MKHIKLLLLLTNLTISGLVFANTDCQWYKITNRTTTSQSGNDRYIVSYPFFSGDCLENANKMLDYKVQNLKDKNTLDKSEHKTQETGGNELDVNYQFLWLSKNFMSIRFYTTTYFAGQAHPVTTFDTINYDLNQQKVLTMGDLFKQDSQFLQILVNSSRKILEQNLLQTTPGDEKENAKKWIQEGSEGLQKNFQAWNLTPDGLLITFQPMQVTDYAQGKQEVTIPYSELKTVMKPGISRALEEKTCMPDRIG